MSHPSINDVRASDAPDNLIKNPLDKRKEQRDRDSQRESPDKREREVGDNLITNPLDKPDAGDNLITNPLDRR